MVVTTSLDSTLLRLDAWFDTMRQPGGYGGPVVHWWQQCFVFTGAAHDWRYEGIIDGYTTLYERTQQQHWLAKACRAADDLLAAQLPTGNFTASVFEANPATAGTPHEAACAAALLRLARTLQQHTHSPYHVHWQLYAAAAERTIRDGALASLWDETTAIFHDTPHAHTIGSFVPNKAATLCEALFQLAHITQNDEWVTHYALPTLSHMLTYQVRDDNNNHNHNALRDGAFAQNRLGNRLIAKYFPLYNARCVPALVQAYHWSNDERFADAALRCANFLARSTKDNGALPMVIYRNTTRHYPAWIAPLGDVLRAWDACSTLNWHTPRYNAVLQRILSGQDSSGGIQTARGFTGNIWGMPSCLPDVRDILHVVGWCDKAFRALAQHSSKQLPDATHNETEHRSKLFESPCIFRGKHMWYVELPSLIHIQGQGKQVYRWMKQHPWAEQATRAFWLR